MEYARTNDITEMINIGRAIIEERPDLYNRKTSASQKKRLADLFGGGITEDDYFRFTYDFWTYGVSVEEYVCYQFYKLSPQEKEAYLTDRNRYVYIEYLNSHPDFFVLVDKYATYERIKPYFRRDVVKISEDDLQTFLDFTDAHPVFFLKPTDLGLAAGIKKLDVRNTDREKLFHKLFKIRKGINSLVTDNREHSLDYVCEEMIVEEPSMAAFHPLSVNGIRLNTILKRDGSVEIFYPWFRIGSGRKSVCNGGAGGIVANIDPSNGIVYTDGCDEKGVDYTFHPDSGLRFKGFVIPRWDEILDMARELAQKFSTVPYIGWDFALTDGGWCVIEANPNGQLWVAQLAIKRGLRKEFESLIDYKKEQYFWWQEVEDEDIYFW